MYDLISRKAAIDAIVKQSVVDKTVAKRVLAQLPSAEPERKIYDKMSDEEFEKWLYEHGICHPDIHETIPCKAVQLLIDYAINELPSAEPKWIPVSERLPEDYQDVLVWFEYFRYGDYNCMYSTYGIGNYSNRYDSWLINHETGWTDLHVFAWMPLPEPYKGGE